MSKKKRIKKKTCYLCGGSGVRFMYKLGLSEMYGICLHCFGKGEVIIKRGLKKRVDGY